MTDRKLVDAQTAGDLEGEFIDLTEGLTIRGILERAFATSGEFGIQACYGIRGRWSIGQDTYTEKDEMILTGERPFFKEAIRALKLGTYVELTFLKKEAFGKKGLKMWKGSLRYDDAGAKGASVRQALADYYKTNAVRLGAARPVMAAVPAATEDVPF